MLPNNLFAPPFSVEIIESCALIVQFRFPRSKKSRIQRKWSKNLANFKADPQVYQIQGKLYAHPQTARRMKEMLDKSKEVD